MQIIELCGLPGCGKTTLSERIIKYLRERSDCRVYKRQEITFPSLIQKCLWKVQLVNPTYYFSTYKMAIDDYLKGKSKPSRYFKYRLGYLASNLTRLEGKEDSFAVLDEGIIEGIVSLSHGIVLRDDEELIELTNKFRFNDHVIVACESICPEVALNRIVKRASGGERYLKHSQEESLKLMQIKGKNIATLLKHYEDHYNVRICRLDMSKSQDEIFADFLNWFAS